MIGKKGPSSCAEVGTSFAELAAEADATAAAPTTSWRLVTNIASLPPKGGASLRPLEDRRYAFFERFGAWRMASVPPPASTASVTRSELVAVIGAICTGRLIPIR